MKQLQVIGIVLLTFCSLFSQAQSNYFVSKKHKSPNVKLYNQNYFYAQGYLAGHTADTVVIRSQENEQLYSFAKDSLYKIDFRKGAGFWPAAGTTYSVLLGFSLLTLAEDNDFVPPLARLGLLAAVSVPIAAAAGGISELKTKRAEWDKNIHNANDLETELNQFCPDSVLHSAAYPSGFFTEQGQKPQSPAMTNSQHLIDIYLSLNYIRSTFKSQISSNLDGSILGELKYESSLPKCWSFGALVRLNSNINIGIEHFVESSTNVRASFYTNDNIQLTSYRLDFYSIQNLLKLQYKIFHQPVNPQSGSLLLGAGIRFATHSYFQYFDVGHEIINPNSVPSVSNYSQNNRGLDVELIYKRPLGSNFSASVKAFGSFFNYLETGTIHYDYTDGSQSAYFKGANLQLNYYGMGAALHWRFM